MQVVSTSSDGGVSLTSTSSSGVSLTSIGMNKASAPLIAAVLTAILTVLTIAGIASCHAPGGVSNLMYGAGFGSIEVGSVKYSFTNVIVSSPGGSATLPIAPNPCPGSFSGLYTCASLDNFCLPKDAHSMFVASKITAAFAIFTMVAIAVMFVLKKHNGCSICGLFWLVLILTSISAATAAAGATTAHALCYPSYLALASVSSSPGAGVSLLIACLVFQFILWIVAQATCPSSSSPTVVIVQNQAPPQGQYVQYAPGQQQYAPQQYAPQQYPPQQYPPQQYPPQQNAPQQQYPSFQQQYASQPNASAPQQYAPQQYAPQPNAPTQQHDAQQYAPAQQQNPSEISKPSDP